MQSLLRLLIWGLAVLFAASPVLLSVVKSPSHQGDLLDPASFVQYSRDIVFAVIAIIAIGMIDALEVLASFFGSEPAHKTAACVAFILVIAFIPLLSIFVTWAAPGNQMTGLDLRNMSTLGGASLVCAFGARMTTILGA